MKIKPQTGRKIFANYLSNKEELVSRTYKELKCKNNK